MNSEWKRNCPVCGIEIICSSKWYMDDSNRKNRKCVKCYNRGEFHPNYGKSLSEDTKNKIKNSHSKKSPEDYYWYGKHLDDNHKNKLRKSKIGSKLSNETKQKIKTSMIGNSNRSGICHDEESKRKMRISKANYVMRNLGNKICPAFNEISCLYFEWLNKWNGWNGRYAINGGEKYIDELGYWVDYYEPKHNIVIEWDEKRHYNVDGSLKENDIIRMNRIKQHLQCRFFRYNEKLNELKEW